MRKRKILCKKSEKTGFRIAFANLRGRLVFGFGTHRDPLQPGNEAIERQPFQRDPPERHQDHPIVGAGADRVSQRAGLGSDEFGDRPHINNLPKGAHRNAGGEADHQLGRAVGLPDPPEELHALAPIRFQKHRQDPVPGEVAEADRPRLHAGARLDRKIGDIREDERRPVGPDCLRLGRHPVLPVLMKAQVLRPGGVAVDVQRPPLHATDILPDRAQLPGKAQAALKEPRGHLRAQQGRESGDAATQFVQDGHHLRGVAESMAGDGAPNAFHRDMLLPQTADAIAILGAMSCYATYLFPYLMDWSMGTRKFHEQRREALKPLRGDVLEIGFGTGLNLTHYPPAVARVVALDPARLLPGKVAGRMAAASMPVRLVYGSAERLPFGDRRFDCVASTWTLCTIPDVAAALRELRRALKPGGQYVFLEHGRSDTPFVARWQDRLNPLQRRIGVGCNMNRRIDRLITEAGFKLERLDRFQMSGIPRLVGEMYRGIASAH